MKKLLWVGDAGVPSGFAQATHKVLDTLHHIYDTKVLGINYRGDPHKYPYELWAAAVAGDGFGVGRLVWMCDMHKPDVIVIQQDGWNIPLYVNQLRLRKSNGEYAFPDHAAIPIVAIVAVDGKNFQGQWLDGVSLAIFWTQFALDEAREGGYTGPACVIPLGVDLSVFYPMDRAEARSILPPQLHEKFIVGCVNRNQYRKRWDLLVKYFAKWITDYAIRDAYLYLHTAPTGDQVVNVRKLAAYYGVVDRLATVSPETWYGLSEDSVRATYNCFDVNATTTQGEGFGLTTLESMACGVSQIVPDWSALGDWTRGAAWLVPCSTTNIGPPFVGVIGGVADEKEFVQALHRNYTDQRTRENNAKAALERAEQKRFDWKVIGNRYVEVLDCAFNEHNWTEDVLTGVTMCSKCEKRQQPVPQEV